MGMPISKAGDMSLGHAFSPSPITPATATVMAANKGLARLMDTGDCGAMIGGTAATVMAGG